MSEYSLIPVILSGGSGSRLWPLSRKFYPKQFIPVKDNKSLFQKTVQRANSLDRVGETMVICNEEHRFMAAEQLRQVDIEKASIILEPVGRNTAPAITTAAIHAFKQNPKANLLVLPADHVLTDLQEFQLAVYTAASAAKDMLLTFGIVPNRVETGFGYIKQDHENPITQGENTLYPVKSFVEKPDYKTAESYINSGDYFWNSGMFLFNAEKYLHEIENLQPDILEYCQQAYDKSQRDLDFIRLDQTSFVKAPNISVDYAVMEQTDKAGVVPLNCEWSDVGSWHAWWESYERDEDDNATHGDVITKDCSGTYIHSSNRLVTAIGVKDYVIIETTDAVLVLPRERAQEVKDIVDELNKNSRSETEIHPKVYRPWGSYETIDIEDRFQVKRITVYPNQILSLQMHHHRAEHWIIVKGTAKVTKGEKEFLLSENESTFIPVGTKHRLENPGMINLELIEVQSGAYLGEDDITRFEDVYGR